MIERPTHPRVDIHYERPSESNKIYYQRVVLERADVVITLSEPLELPEPMIRPDGTMMLETGSLALWFTFPGVWHDIGRFHRADGSETGIYANVLTPPVFEGPIWRTTDLYLDVWIPAGGEAQLLDVDELDEALVAGHIDAPTAERARAEASHLMSAAEAGTWPPRIVSEWPLERALERLEELGST